MFPSGTELIARSSRRRHARALRRADRASRPRTCARTACRCRTATGCSSSPSLGVGAVAILVDLVAVGLRRPALAGLPMLAIYSVPVAVYADSVPVAPVRGRRRSASSGCWSPTTSTRSAGSAAGSPATAATSTSGSRRRWPPPAAGSPWSAWSLAVLLPIAVPGHDHRPARPVRRRAPASGTGLGGSGGSGTVNLFAALAGQLQPDRDDRRWSRSRTNDPNPFYLRFARRRRAHRPTGFRGRGRRAAQPAAGSLPGPAGRPARRASTYEALPGRRSRSTDRFEMPLAPIYGEPIDIDGLDGDWHYDPNMQVVFSNRRDRPGQEVRVRLRPARLHRRGAAHRAAAGRRTAPRRRSYTQVPVGASR